MQPPTAPHCIATKRKNPSNNSGGLGSWREQQQTNDANQKFTCRLTRPPQVSEGFVISVTRLMPLRRFNYTHFLPCQHFFY